MSSQETIGSGLGLQIANFINFNDKDDIGYLFDRTDEGSNEEWNNYF